MSQHVSTITLPSHWACYLINGDASGLDDGEAERIAAHLNAELPSDAAIVAVIEDSERFTWSFRLYGGDASGGDVADFTVLQPGARAAVQRAGSEDAPTMVPQQVQQQQAKARSAGGTVEIFVFERDDAYWWNLSRADAGRRGPFNTDGDAAVAAARAHPRNACSYHYLCAPAARTVPHHARAESCCVETRTLAGDVVRRHGPFPRNSGQFSDVYHSEMSAALGHNRMRRHDDPSCQRVHIVTEVAR